MDPPAASGLITPGNVIPSISLLFIISEDDSIVAGRAGGLVCSTDSCKKITISFVCVDESSSETPMNKACFMFPPGLKEEPHHPSPPL